jgi:hypothetical protein
LVGLIGAAASSAPRAAVGDAIDLPAVAQATVSATLGRTDDIYHAVQSSDGYRAENPHHALAITFAPDAVDVRTDGVRWGLALIGYGREGTMLNAMPVSPRASANRIEYHRGALTEWYVNGPSGLEQGFTLSSAPSPAVRGEVTVALALSGNATATGDTPGEVTVLGDDGRAALRYRGLAAFDATGRSVPAWLEVTGDQLLLHADDRDARYPLVIDPFIQLAKLTASDAAQGDQLGFTVAISGDTVVAGAPFAKIGSNINQGAAYVFVKAAGGWATMTETAKLTASDGAAGDELGVVAISGDTIAVGSSAAKVGSNAKQGAVYVFVKPVSGWMTATETAKLTASDGAASDGLGSAVAVDSDAVIAGASGAKIGSNIEQGAAYVFVKPLGGWMTENETAKLTASDGAAKDGLGVLGVAIDADTAVAGVPEAKIGSNTTQGAAYVFVKAPGGWATMTETAKLTASDGAAGDELGRSVGVSGSVVVSGALFATGGSNTNQGAVYVFVKPVAGWATATQTAKLTASDGAGDDLLGGWVAISGDRVVAGAIGAQIGANDNQGAAYVFVRPAGGWTSETESAKLVASDGALQDEFGRCVAIDGATVAVGSFMADLDSSTDQGAAYVFGQADGTPCAVDAECASLHCADAVCCDSSCSGACESCNLAGNVGTCTADAAGSAGDPSCAPFVCDGAQSGCPSSCTADSGCASNAFCTGTTCSAKEPNGGACSGDSVDPTGGHACTSGNCVDGVCCNTACMGATLQCDVPGHVGECTVVGRPAEAPTLSPVALLMALGLLGAIAAAALRRGARPDRQVR